MNQDMQDINDNKPKVKPITLIVILALIIGSVLLIEQLIFKSPVDKEAEQKAADTTASNLADLFAQDDMWLPPDDKTIPENDSGKMIRYGRELVVHTAKYFGPQGSLLNTTNGMNCQNCHLEAGTKPFGNNFSAVASTYPKFKPRSGANETIEKKVSDCFERSLNGKPLDSKSREMKAFVAYLKWLGSEVKIGEAPKGSGIMSVPFLTRAADVEKGKLVFEQQCAKCHGKDGQGNLITDNSSETRLQPSSATEEDLYRFPPLWGTHSYNIGASMYRLSRLAGYVKANMPYPTNYTKPVLTDEEAWDVAAFVNSMQRPQKDLSQDWPDVSKKSYDYPFGPYTDDFNESQHKYGPFAEMPSAKMGK